MQRTIIDVNEIYTGLVPLGIGKKAQCPVGTFVLLVFGEIVFYNVTMPIEKQRCC